ncbi:negative elongation factor D-like isoform X2 [Gordionus sp. m RMFG-2023]|uniref:negative elongation factor D-like isoform X2 n=1 Tax=Gordionus sp. m RMFG-2023 TaxID=3053472 RepID=UPI0031FE187B
MMQNDENSAQIIIEKCLKNFASKDYIMETDIFASLKRYFEVGGEPEKVVYLLSENYYGTAQMSNILVDLLLFTGCDLKSMQTIIEDHLKELMIKRFNPKMADKIFIQEEYNILSWLPEMINHSTWRSLIYNLSEQYSDCLFLNFAIKLISDAGFQNEITSISTASQQIEIFSKVINSSVTSLLKIGDENMIIQKLVDFKKLVCHGEHTYLYSISLLQTLIRKFPSSLLIKRIVQEAQNYASEMNLESCAINMGVDKMARYPKLHFAVSSMLSKKALNPADITLLYKLFISNDAPPSEMIRNPIFLELLVEALFKPQYLINPDHKHKYIYLLAYAVSVYEQSNENGNIIIKKEEMKPLIQALEKAHNLCNKSHCSSEILYDLSTLFHLIRFPIIALGIFKWVSNILQEPGYFINRTDSWNAYHLTLLDEIVTCHSALHDRILKLYIQLFQSSFPDLEVLIQLELKKSLLERMVHLFSRGCVIPVLSFIIKCWEKQDTDVSLIRHFVQETYPLDFRHDIATIPSKFYQYIFANYSKQRYHSFPH